MDPHSGRVYPTLEAAKAAGVDEPLEVTDVAHGRFVLTANGRSYANTKAARRRARKAQRRARKGNRR